MQVSAATVLPACLICAISVIFLHMQVIKIQNENVDSVVQTLLASSIIMERINRMKYIPPALSDLTDLLNICKHTQLY